MTRILCLTAVAALAIAGGGCNRSDTNRKPEESSQASGNQSNEPARAIQSGQAASGADSGRTTDSGQEVTLTGCLTGGEMPTATSGSAARPPVASRRPNDEVQAMRGDTAAASRFMLMRATAASGD